MVDFPDGTPDLPNLNPLDPPGSAAGGLGIRALINRANDNILNLIDRMYNGPSGMDPIINGGPLIWSDAISYPSIANQAYGPDQWRWHFIGAGVVDMLLSTNTPAIGDNTQRMPYSLQVSVTTADAAIAAGDFYFIEHIMEGFLWTILAQREFTIRFWVMSPVVGRHYVAFVNIDGTKSYLAPYDIAVANTWEEKSITVPASPSAGTWNYESGTGLRMRFVLAAGTTFHGTAGAWTDGNLMSASDQVNAMATAANVFRICGLTARPGPYCPPYMQRSFAVEELLCRRYFEVLANGVNSVLGSGICISTTQADFLCPMHPKRTAPTVTVTTIANLKVYHGAGVSTNCTALTVVGTGRILPLMRATVASGLTAGAAAVILGQVAVVKIDARLA